MDADVAPRPGDIHSGEEEKIIDEPMAQEEVAPPVVLAQVPPSAEEKVLVPPEIEKESEEKALEPKEKQAEQSAEKMTKKTDQVTVSAERKAKKNDRPSSSLKPSSKGKSKKYVAPLKPIDENVSAPDDAATPVGVVEFP